MNLEPTVSLRINGKPVSKRKLEVLEAISQEGSQNRAAERLGISTPVLHRYLNTLESEVGETLVRTTMRGTKLTGEGKAVVREFSALKKRAEKRESVVIGCTIITQELLNSLLSRVARGNEYALIISDDERNLEDFKAGLMDLVILDDPLYVYEYSGPTWEEIGEDYLIHVDRGSKYLRFKYGAQRIGFKHLAASGKDFTVQGEVRSIPFLLKSNLSFFLNHSIAVRKGLSLRSATPPALLKHKIIALYDDTHRVNMLVEELKKEKF